MNFFTYITFQYSFKNSETYRNSDSIKIVFIDITVRFI